MERRGACSVRGMFLCNIGQTPAWRCFWWRRWNLARSCSRFHNLRCCVRTAVCDFRTPLLSTIKPWMASSIASHSSSESGVTHSSSTLERIATSAAAKAPTRFSGFVSNKASTYRRCHSWSHCRFMTRHSAGEEIEEIVEVRWGDFCSVSHRLFTGAVLAADRCEKRDGASNCGMRGCCGDAREVEENAKRNYSEGAVFNLIDAKVRKRRKALKERL